MPAYRGTNPPGRTTMEKPPPKPPRRPPLLGADDGLGPLTYAGGLRKYFPKNSQSAQPPTNESERDRPSDKATLSNDGKAPDLPGTKTLDYLGLGLLLATPAVVVDMYLKGTEIDWRKTAIAAAISWITGGFAVWASHHWQSWRTSDNRVVPLLVAFAAASRSGHPKSLYKQNSPRFGGVL